jgi:CSLREA domain-containing protein
MKSRSRAGWLGVLLALPLQVASAASLVTVTSTADNETEDGQCTLREAARVTFAAPVADCPVEVTGASEPLIIRLQSRAEYRLIDESLPIDDNTFTAVEIDGRGATIARHPDSTELFPLVVVSASDFTLRDATLRDGRARTGGALENFSQNQKLFLQRLELIGNEALGSELGQGVGGAVSITSTEVLVEACTFSLNRSDRFAGALRLSGVTGRVVDTRFESNSSPTSGALSVAGSDLRIERSDFYANTADFGGGAIAMETNTALVIEDSTFNGNEADPSLSISRGGAIRISGPITIRRSLFTGNAAASGGALYRGFPLAGTGVIENTTFHENTANAGGAILIERGVLQVVSSTLVGNEAGNGAGVRVLDNPATSVFVDHTLIVGNSAGSCQGARQTGGGYSILDSACGFPARTGDITGADNGNDAIVATALANNGGRSLTLALNPSGPARNAGNRTYLDRTDRDQRGFVRVAEGRVDIGAVEFGAQAAGRTLDAVFASGFQAGEPGRFDDRQAFLDVTGAGDATGALPDLGNLSGQASPVSVGRITYLPLPPSSLNFDQWTAALPDLGPGDTVDLALNDLEQFDMRTDDPVTSLGFDFVDPDGDGTRFSLQACRTVFDPVTEWCPPGDVVYATDFSSANTGRAFVGFRASSPFRQVSIREQTNSNTNEYFGHVFTAP